MYIDRQTNAYINSLFRKILIGQKLTMEERGFYDCEMDMRCRLMLPVVLAQYSKANAAAEAADIAKTKKMLDEKAAEMREYTEAHGVPCEDCGVKYIFDEGMGFICPTCLEKRRKAAQKLQEFKQSEVVERHRADVFGPQEE
jgi:hypothetical protein